MNKKICAAFAGIIVVFIVMILAFWNGQDKKISLAELSKNLDCDDSKKLLDDLPGKSIYISGGKCLSRIRILR